MGARTPRRPADTAAASNCAGQPVGRAERTDATHRSYLGASAAPAGPADSGGPVESAGGSFVEHTCSSRGSDPPDRRYAAHESPELGNRSPDSSASTQCS